MFLPKLIILLIAKCLPFIEHVRLFKILCILYRDCIYYEYIVHRYAALSMCISPRDTIKYLLFLNLKNLSVFEFCLEDYTLETFKNVLEFGEYRIFKFLTSKTNVPYKYLLTAACKSKDIEKISKILDKLYEIIPSTALFRKEVDKGLGVICTFYKSDSYAYERLSHYFISEGGRLRNCFKGICQSGDIDFVKKHIYSCKNLEAGLLGAIKIDNLEIYKYVSKFVDKELSGSSVTKYRPYKITEYYMPDIADYNLAAYGDIKIIKILTGSYLSKEVRKKLIHNKNPKVLDYFNVSFVENAKALCENNSIYVILQLEYRHPEIFKKYEENIPKHGLVFRFIQIIRGF